jgi:predicted PurR-regulated permease PerM
MTTNARHRYFRICFITAVFLLFGYLFSPFFPSIILAILFAFAFEKHVRNFSQRRIRRRGMTMAFLLSMFLLITVPITLVIIQAVSKIKHYADVGLQNTSLYQGIEKLIHQLSSKANGFAQSFNVDLSQLPSSNELLNRGTGFIGPFATKLLAALPEIALGVFVFALFLYFLLTQSHKIKKSISKLDLMSSEELDQLIEITQKSSFTALVASAMVGCMQAVLLATIAYFLGYTEFLMIFVVTFIFSLIPLVGATPVALFLALISYIEGNTGVAIGLLVAASASSAVDHLVKPLLINSSNEDLHPVIGLLSLIGAIYIFGAPGIIIGPVVTELAFNVGDIFFPIINYERNPS